MSVPCPACDDALVLSGRSPVYGCESCGGLWLDNLGARQLMDGKLPAETRAFIERVDGLSAKTPPTKASYRGAPRKTARTCPECGKALEAQACMGLEIDVCLVHGTFLDRHEALRIARTTTQWAALDKEQREMEEANGGLLAFLARLFRSLVEGR